jgi:hypothetical protein
MWRFVGKLFYRNREVDAGHEGANVGKAFSLDDMIRAPGKACYATLTKLVSGYSRDEFVELVHSFALVGSAIRDGDVAAPKVAQMRGIERTFLFVPSLREMFVEGATLEQCIFLLRKSPAGRSVAELRRFTIGRSKDNDLVMMDFAISRAHAELSLTDSYYVIRDLGSSNGTRVNGRLVEGAPAIVRDGDVLSFGRYEFQLLSSASLYDLLQSRSGPADM